MVIVRGHFTAMVQCVVLSPDFVAHPEPKSSLTMLTGGREREGFQVCPRNFSRLLNNPEYNGWSKPSGEF